MNIWKSLYIRPLFFLVLTGILLFFGLSQAFPVLFFPAKLVLLAFAGSCIVEITVLFSLKYLITCERKVAGILSMGDPNTVHLQLHNKVNRHLRILLQEELPMQLQIRNFSMEMVLAPGEEKSVQYTITPKERGQYHFYHTLLFVRSPLNLFERKIQAGTPQVASVYPSTYQTRKFQLQSQVVTQMNGVRKVRRLGHNYEFDHIKSYVVGDDYKSINWKMTGKRHSLMVNQYGEERAQQMYCLIDNGRAMRMPFGGMRLLDYAINSSLVLCSTATQKHDRAGLLTFSKKISAFLKADASPRQLQKIFQHLYNEQETEHEPNFELLYTYLKRNITLRSVLFLYTNFESSFSVTRALPVLRMLNKMHLVVVILFENEEIRHLAVQNASSLEEIYSGAIAEKLVYEKKQLAGLLRQHGIQTVLTAPEKLTVNAINKYLELKARGLA